MKSLKLFLILVMICSIAFSGQKQCEMKTSIIPENDLISTSIYYDYLIITDNSYFNEITPFVDWKRKLDFSVKVVNVNTIGNSVSSIKNYILGEYNNCGIDYVLFVGNASSPTWATRNVVGRGPGDFYYSLLVGGSTNYDPDVAIGRFSVDNSTELETLIRKTIAYETQPNLGNWSSKCLLIAHRDDAPDGFEGCSDIISDAQYTNTPTFTKVYGSEGKTNTDISNAINSGHGIVNYRGHGGVDTWSGWNGGDYTTTNINNLTNDEKLSVLFSIACETAKIDATQKSLIETFLTTEFGASTGFGGTTGTDNNYNDELDITLFDEIYNSDKNIIGEVVNEGRHQIAVGSEGIGTAHEYILLGDPSLKLWTELIDIYQNVQITDNGTSLTVNTNDTGSTITLTKEGESGSYLTVSNVSNYTFNTSQRPLYITITKENYKPYLAVTGGIFSSDQYWFGDMEVIGDVTIIDNGKLIILSGTSIDLGDNKVVADGGCEIPENFTISSDIKSKSGNTIKGIYGDLSDAFLTGGLDGPIVEVRDYCTLNDNLTVSSDKTLILYPGSELQFASGKYLDIYGTLTADDATFSNSSSSAWGGIKLRANSVASISNCSIFNASYGIYTKYVDPDIENCEIDNDVAGTSYGIYNYYGDPIIRDNIIDCTWGIYNYNASPELRDNQIESYNGGLYCSGNSSPILASISNGNGNNEFFGTTTILGGVYASGNSNPVVGFTTCDWDTYGRNSFVYTNYINDKLVYNGTYNFIWAQHCWWGTSSPSSSLFSNDVIYQPYLTSMPTYSVPIVSPEEELFALKLSASIDLNNESYEDLTIHYSTEWKLKKKIEYISYLLSLGEANGVADLCMDIIADYPDSSEAFTALDMIYQISKKDKIKKDIDEKTLKTYLKTFDRKFKNSSLKANALLLLAGMEKDMELVDKVYKECKDGDWGKYALNQKFMYYFHDEENTEMAREVLDLMDKVYPDEIVTYEAHVHMGDEVEKAAKFYAGYFGNEQKEKVQYIMSELTETLPENYELSNAYPNPFNPSTMLDYALPVQSEVNCTIYDLSGNVVKIYSFSQTAGHHSIVWNGSNVSSGIYLIHFVAEAQDGSNSFVDYQKVTLLK